MIHIIGAGPSGLTAALLLARQGHKVILIEKEKEIGGLWASRIDTGGFFESENSCKVYQSSYKSAPTLFEAIGTRWEDHFIARHDLKKQWLRPFLADSSLSDLRRLFFAFLLNLTGFRTYRTESVYDYMNRHNFSEACRKWMRATALGGVTGTMRMTMWELFHRFRYNLRAIFFSNSELLYWNAQPPNSAAGFVSQWRQELERQGVEIVVNCGVRSLYPSIQDNQQQVLIERSDGVRHRSDAVFLAIPPPAMSHLLKNSHADYTAGWGHPETNLHEVLEASIYEHLGLSWIFDKELPQDLPLGGHGVRSGWHPILVQYSQYQKHLKAPGKTVVIGSISLDTEFRHQRLGTRAQDHEPHELAKILWDDEQLADSSLPDPVEVQVYGLSAATQIVKHGPLSIKNEGAPLYIATSINGKSPYFTASLESAIQAGNAAAAAFDIEVTRLPT
ncbi:FAD-dependent oxidoreductase [bacterium]|nr:FAD-dependent oxidoreductase [bacterium]